MAICNVCKNIIPKNASQRPYCGRNQDDLIKQRNWKCSSCGALNGPERSICWNCNT